jgi:hypothetical protein
MLGNPKRALKMEGSQNFWLSRRASTYTALRLSQFVTLLFLNAFLKDWIDFSIVGLLLSVTQLLFSATHWGNRYYIRCRASQWICQIKDKWIRWVLFLCVSESILVVVYPIVFFVWKKSKGMATIDLGYWSLDSWSHLGPKLDSVWTYRAVKTSRRVLRSKPDQFYL